MNNTQTKPRMPPIVAKQLQRNRRDDAKPKQITEDDVLRSAKRLDEGVREFARRFQNLLWDLRHVNPDVRREVCGALGAEGLAETALQIFHTLRFDSADEVPSFETLLADALKRQALRR